MKLCVDQVQNLPWENTFNIIIENYKKNSDPKFVRKVIYNKSFRPKLIDEQASLLYAISESAIFEPVIIINATTAFSHKAMESHNIELCNIALEKINAILESNFDLPYSEDIRSDYLHVLFSLYSVALHLSLYLKKYNKVIQLSNDSNQLFDKLCPSNFKSGFYQTSGNVLRCLIFLTAFSDKNADPIFLKRNLDKFSEILHLALTFADDDKVKFLEFKTYFRIYWCMNDLYELTKSNSFGDEYSSLKLKLLRISLRHHDSEKVNLLISNYAEFQAGKSEFCNELHQ
ncbi:MAG: hypothetical protein NWQ54_01125 [Paraglaciecola sp.]|nr:hypothetical protein [Paraglaciecola sp.]